MKQIASSNSSQILPRAIFVLFSSERSTKNLGHFLWNCRLGYDMLKLIEENAEVQKR